MNYEFGDLKAGTDSKEVRKKGSILLKDEKANQIFEYDANQLIISLAETDLLIVKDYRPI